VTSPLRALEQRKLELPLELPAGPLLLSNELQVELPLLGPLALAEDDEMVRPGDLSQQCRDCLARADVGLAELSPCSHAYLPCRNSTRQRRRNSSAMAGGGEPNNVSAPPFSKTMA
jgi:hypothetical protein